MTEVLKISNLTKKINDKIILSDINLLVESKQIVALLGADKTESEVLFRILAGMTKADSGEVNINNNILNCNNVKDALCRGILMITAETAVAGDLNIKEHITLGLSQKVDSEEIIKALREAGLEKIGLSTLCKYLSVSEKYYYYWQEQLSVMLKYFCFIILMLHLTKLKDNYILIF